MRFLQLFWGRTERIRKLEMGIDYWHSRHDHLEATMRERMAKLEGEMKLLTDSLHGRKAIAKLNGRLGKTVARVNQLDARIRGAEAESIDAPGD